MRSLKKKNILSEAKALRRKLHQHPEPGFLEFGTAEILRGFLKFHDIRFRKIGTGTVVDIGRPVVALRTDIDALPIFEKTGFSYQSRNKGYMHACGHDFHMAIVSLTLLKLMEKRISRVRVIYQPSEEGPESGAKSLVKNGVLKGIKAIFALHVDPGIRLGRIGIRSGSFMAAANHFQITISGKASHAALPHLGTDTIYCASRLIEGIQAIISRKKNPVKPGLITVGKIYGGERFNILAKETVLEGTIRALELSVLKKLKDELTLLCQSLGQDYKVRIKIKFSDDFPPVVNDHKLTEIVLNSALSILGKDSVLGIPPTMGSEDFSYYQIKIPGVMFMLGVRDQKFGSIHSLHHDHFKAPEQVIEIGSEILLKCCQFYLS